MLTLNGNEQTIGKKMSFLSNSSAPYENLIVKSKLTKVNIHKMTLTEDKYNFQISDDKFSAFL